MKSSIGDTYGSPQNAYLKYCATTLKARGNGKQACLPDGEIMMNCRAVVKGCLWAVGLIFGSTSFANVSAAQPTYPMSLEVGTCPPPLTPPAVLLDAIKNGTIESLIRSKPPELIAFEEEMKRQTASDWGNLCRYQKADVDLIAEVMPSDRIVFLGDSITENWASFRTAFLDNKVMVGRGIGGQVSGQILLRFQQDVIALRPKVVHIMIGTNDLAGAQTPIRFATIQNNIISMVQLARANHITPVLGSILPAEKFVLPVPSLAPPKIDAMNTWLHSYTSREGLIYIDYHRVLVAPNGAMRKDLTIDGIHPNSAGYALMEPMTREAIRKALLQRR